MAVIPKALSRNQLARFIPDNESIIRFQALFKQAGETLPGAIEETTIETSTTAAQLAAMHQIIDDSRLELEFLMAAICIG